MAAAGLAWCAFSIAFSIPLLVLPSKRASQERLGARAVMLVRDACESQQLPVTCIDCTARLRYVCARQRTAFHVFEKFKKRGAHQLPPTWAPCSSRMYEGRPFSGYHGI